MLQDGYARGGRPGTPTDAQHLRPVRRQPQTATRDTSELYYNDLDGDGYLSDDERDEDADGLTNYDESHGRMYRRRTGTSCYSDEKPYHVAYAGTDIADADTDGDGVRDGADDQDHDDIPNLAELSRFDASGPTSTARAPASRTRTRRSPRTRTTRRPTAA